MMTLIQRLNLTSFLSGEKETSSLDVAMWRAQENVCELADQGACVTEHGYYFGTSDSREPKFCPAHFFGDLGYELEPVID